MIENENVGSKNAEFLKVKATLEMLGICFNYMFFLVISTSLITFFFLSFREPSLMCIAGCLLV